MLKVEKRNVRRDIYQGLCVCVCERERDRDRERRFNKREEIEL
jgi:hypothetical protein